MKIDKSSLVYGTFFLTVVNVISQGLAFFYRIALTRLIGAENMGLYQLLMPVYVVLTSIAYSGLTVAISRIVAEKSAVNDICGIRAVLNAALRIFLITAVILSAVVFIFSNQISLFAGDIRTRKGLLLLLPCLVLTGIENISKNYFYGINNIKIPAIMEVLEQIVRISAVILLLIFINPPKDDDKVMLIALGMVICEVFSSLVLTFLRLKYIKKCNSNKQISKNKFAVYKRILAISLPICATNLSGSVMDSLNSALIPKRLVESGLSSVEALESFGTLFGMSLPLLTLPTVFISAICLIIVPSLASVIASNNYQAARIKISKIFFYSLIITLPVTAFVLPIAPYIGELLFGRKEVGENLLLPAISMIINAVQAVSGSIVYGLGKQKAATVSFIIGDYIQVAFTYFLVAIPSLRLMGFVIGLIVSALVTTIINFVIIVKTVSLKIKLFEWFILPFLSSIPVFSLSSFGFSFFQENQAFMPCALIGLTMVSVIVYLITVKLLRSRFHKKPKLFNNHPLTP